MKHEVNFATLRLGVMLCLLTLLLSMTLRLSLAQYPTMIPVTGELLTVQPTTQAKRVQEDIGNEDRDRLCDLCASMVEMEIERGDGDNLCDLCDSAVGEESGRSDE